MTWQDFAAVGSGAISLIMLLASTLGRETVGELKRRVTTLEQTPPGKEPLEEVKRRVDALEVKDEARARDIAKLEERSNGTAASLARIEAQMVPRAEWETRHSHTESLLHQILSMLGARESSPQLEPPPVPPRRK